MERAPTQSLILASLAAVFAAACSTEPPVAETAIAEPPQAAAPVVLGQGAVEARMHVEPVTHVRFPIVAAGITVSEEHFDPALPAHKFKHSIHLARDGRRVVLIDVWDNPDKRPLRAWFDATLAFLVQSRTRVSERPMSRAGVGGIYLEEPRSPQALSQAIAVFASGEQVFRVTCIDPEGDPDAKRLFDVVVARIETGVTP